MMKEELGMTFFYPSLKCSPDFYKYISEMQFIWCIFPFSPYVLQLSNKWALF